MKELLERWAELEPSRCKIEAWADNYGHWVQQDIITVWVGPRASGGYKVEIIQHAVQQAIEARGWMWSICRLLAGSCGSEIATRDMANLIVSVISSSVHKEPSEALLSAYIQALEATNE